MKEKKTFFTVFLLMLTLLCGLTVAYFTDHHGKVNAFTIGQVKISFREPKYDLSENVEARKSLVPGQKIVKDPVITNVGKSDAFVFLEVNIPEAKDGGTPKIKAVSETTKKPYTYTGKFFLSDIGKNWVLVSSTSVPKGSSKAISYRKEIYAYGGKSLKALKPGEKTTPLFYTGDKAETLTYFHGLERTFVENYVQNIPVKAYGIQSSDLIYTDRFGDQGETNPAKVWKILSNQLQTEKGGK